MSEQNAFEGAIVAIKGSNRSIEFACSVDIREPSMGVLTRVDAITANVGAFMQVPHVTQVRVALSCLEIIKPRSSQ